MPFIRGGVRDPWTPSGPQPGLQPSHYLCNPSCLFQAAGQEPGAEDHPDLMRLATPNPLPSFWSTAKGLLQPTILQWQQDWSRPLGLRTLQQGREQEKLSGPSTRDLFERCPPGWPVSLYKEKHVETNTQFPTTEMVPPAL